MKYHSGERFGLSETEQSKIYWTCVTYESESACVRAYIDRLCAEIGGQYREILFKAVTTTESLTSLAYKTQLTDFPVDGSFLRKLVSRFYSRFKSGT